MPISSASPSRRVLMLATAALVPAIVAGGPGLQLEARAAAPLGQRPIRLNSTPSFFTPVEWAFVLAFVDRLIPADEEGPGALELGVPTFIDRQMMTPYGFGKLWYLQGPFRPAPATLGYQLPFAPRDIYRIGIKSAASELDRRGVKALGELPEEEQDGFIQQLQDGKVELAPVPAGTLFSQFLNNTREGYFSDPVHGGNRDMAAWKMIGFPGARADFTDWVDRYGAKYPFGPVSITGQGT